MQYQIFRLSNFFLICFFLYIFRVNIENQIVDIRYVKNLIFNNYVLIEKIQKFCEINVS